MKSAFAVLFLTLATLLNLTALEPSFILSDLSEDERLLFGAVADQPGWGEYQTLFTADLADGDGMDTLTHFPERAHYYAATAELEILNRYGLFRTSLDETGRIRKLRFHSSFESGAVIPVGRILPMAPSPDGRWIITQEARTAVRGRLVLYDTYAGSRLIIAENQVLDYRDAPALWSPDSRYLMYSRDGKLFHASVRHVEEARLPDESYREFGRGTLASICWTDGDALFYLDGNRIKLVRPSVFFARSFYADPLPAGTLLGSLPIEFDPHFDSFWPSPDGKSLIILTEGRNLFLFPLSADDTGSAEELPFMLLPGETTILQLWWRSDGKILLLAGGSRRGSSPSTLFRLVPDETGPTGFESLPLQGVRRFVPSPGRDSIAVLKDDGITVMNPDTLDPILSVRHTDPRDLFWIDSQTILIVGGRRSELVSLDEEKSSLIALSSYEKAFFDNEDRVNVISDGRTYLKDVEVGRWHEAEMSVPAVADSRVLESPAHRVYTESSETAYANLVKVRTVDGFGNRVLFPGPVVDRADMSEDGDAGRQSVSAPGIFEHGLRGSGRRVSLVFNAIDGDEGLGDVLNVLADYGIRSTFFVSGDFVRRHPDSAKALAYSGHEIGSLFYTHMDMTDFRYRIDSDFVVRGLGRNEDEFFHATGFEVSTLWHAPWYVVSPPILEATRKMSYAYIGRDVDPMDWVALDGDSDTYRLYKKSAELVEDVLSDKAPGSIIPIRIGKPGKRDDYFFRKLDLLINGLLKDGYEIVNISELMEESR